MVFTGMLFRISIRKLYRSEQWIAASCRYQTRYLMDWVNLDQTMIKTETGLGGLLLVIFRVARRFCNPLLLIYLSKLKHSSRLYSLKQLEKFSQFRLNLLSSLLQFRSFYKMSIIVFGHLKKSLFCTLAEGI